MTSTERDFAIGGALPSRSSVQEDTAAGIDCAVCRQPTIPHPAANVFTEDDPWWVCDSCSDRLAPNAMAVVRQVRDLAGEWAVREVSVREVEDLDGEVGLCPCCGQDFLNAMSDGWMIVRRATDRPLCPACTVEAPRDVVEVLIAVRSFADVRW
jgi:hypothetical protein